MIFETHAHYDDEKFDKDRDKLLIKLQEEGIGYVVNVGASLSSTKASLELAERYEYIYAAVGVHPNETAELNEENFKWLSDMADQTKVVAIGEIGLDYYWKEPEPQIQKIWFERQMELARDKKLPMIIHSRDAAKDTLDMIKACDGGSIGGVIHCYSYGVEIAKEYLDMGFYLGIGGVVTFPNAKKLKEVVQYMPLDRIVLETDCPYLAPVPNRGKRNSSLNLKYVAAKIAELRKIPEEEVIEVTYQNAKKMYQLP